ncbi:MAG: response regulator transcription factor [Geminicoccaceae bacterium]|nr:response regulator transcription factor [Geminicoccaceae bacterium]
MLEDSDDSMEVIVVDDDEAVRDSLSLLLDSEGVNVRTMASGDELLAALDGLGHGVVLLDIRMPGTNGLEVLRVLGERAPDLVIIMITGHGDVPMAVRAMRLGAVDFIEKPFADNRILDAVRSASQTASERRSNAETRERAQMLYERLTPREAEIMKLVAAGHPTKVIAADLDISPRTVEIHRQRIIQKMEVRSLSQLVRLAIAADVDVNWAG